MKRIIVFLLCMTLILGGCAKADDNTGTIPPVVPEVMYTQEVMEETLTALAAVSVPATTESFCLEDGTELFSYTYQHMTLIFPNANIADKITLDFLNRVDTTRSESELILQSAQNDFTDKDSWIPYFYRVLYSPMRIDHGVLSLFGMQNSYLGGMHGNLSATSVSYDMMTGDVLTFGSIMHPEASKDDFITLVLNKLETMKDTHYLYDEYEEAVYDRFGGDENLYEDFYFTQSGLCFYFSPYEIAPYASGTISVELPYSELAGLIYDGYFPEERQVVEGIMQTGTFMDTDMEQFNNMAEVILADGNDLFVVYPEGTVEDIRVHVPGDGMTMPAYTVFAALEMSNKDAVVLNIPAQTAADVQIGYQSVGKTYTIPLT